MSTSPKQVGPSNKILAACSKVCCISDSILDCPINLNSRPLFHYKRSQIPAAAAAGSTSYISMPISLYLFDLCSSFFQNVAILYKSLSCSFQSNYPVVLFYPRCAPLSSLAPTLILSPVLALANELAPLANRPSVESLVLLQGVQC